MRVLTAIPLLLAVLATLALAWDKEGAHISVPETRETVRAAVYAATNAGCLWLLAAIGISKTPLEPLD